MKTELCLWSAEFEALYNDAPCGLLTFNIKGEVINVNQTLLKWLGLHKEEALNCRFTDWLDKGGQLYYQLFVQPLLRINNEVKEINFQITTPQGSFPCLFSASVMRQSVEDGDIINAAIYQVTHRKKYESELLHKKTKAEEEKKFQVETLKEVAWEQSHLVRAPLANVLGIVSLFEEHNLSDEVKHLCEMLKVSATQLDTELKKIISKAASED